MTARYAVYFLPEAGSRLSDFGAGWLGWDVHRGQAVPLRPVCGIGNDQHRALIEAPSVYGFHATLKAPFQLAPEAGLDQLLEAVASLAAYQPAIPDVRLALQRLGRFLALTLAPPDPRVGKMADDCVSELDSFRAPLTQAERRRRRPETLTANQRALLDRWGYPFVFEEYRFHMTLTGPLDSEGGDMVMRALSAATAPLLRHSFVIDALSLVVQDAPGSPFRLLERFPFRG